MPVALQYLITGDVFRWGLIMAGSVIAAVPVMVLYYLAQRFVVQGLIGGRGEGVTHRSPPGVASRAGRRGSPRRTPSLVR